MVGRRESEIEKTKVGMKWADCDGEGSEESMRRRERIAVDLQADW